MDSIKDRPVFSFGEIVWDIFPEEKKLGGAPLNFAYYIGKLGGNSRIVSALGNDDLGHEALEAVNGCGLRTDGIRILDSLPTGVVRVSVDFNGVPQYDISTPAAWDEICWTDREEILPLVRNAGIFAFGTLAQRSRRNRECLREMLSQLSSDAIIVFDANLRQNFYSREIISESMEIADVVKMNEDEFPVISEYCGFSRGSPIDEIAGELVSRFKIKYLLITLGKDGSFVLDKSGKSIRRQGRRINIVDTVGAGDSFTAAFVWNIANGKSMEDASSAAARLSELVCGRKGAFCL